MTDAADTIASEAVAQGVFGPTAYDHAYLALDALLPLAPEGFPRRVVLEQEGPDAPVVVRLLEAGGCGCSFYQPELPPSGQCACGHDEDEHDYHDGWCDATSAALFRLSDVPEEAPDA